MLDFTVRDLLYAAAFVGGLGRLWLVMDRRVTRLEAVNEQLDDLCDRTASLERYRETNGREVGEIAQNVADVSRRVGSLEEQVKDGFKDVLASLGEVKGRLAHDRRGGS